ncbi:MAG: hypothetical protein ABFR63_11550, partial [Thermodesulfobacteriota bacterium]
EINSVRLEWVKEGYSIDTAADNIPAELWTAFSTNGPQRCKNRNGESGSLPDSPLVFDGRDERI